MLKRDVHISDKRLNRLEEEHLRKNSILDQQISIVDQEIAELKRQIKVLSLKECKDCS